jgi:ankyrin repeat protein
MSLLTFKRAVLCLSATQCLASSAVWADPGEALNSRLRLVSEHGNVADVTRCLGQGADASARDMQGCNALFGACRKGDCEVIQLLLDSGAPLNEIAGLGEYPINVAAGQGNLDAVKLLLSRGANIEQPGQFGATPLNDAACAGSLDTVRFLLGQGAEIDAYDSYFRSALSHACLFDRPDAREYQTVVRVLLDAGADANLGAGDFDPPITYALFQANPSTLEMLLNHGADANVKNAWGLTPLHFAGKYRNRAAVPILLAHGARVGDIYQAAVADNVALAGKLLREGVNVKVKDWLGETPLDWAVAMGSARVAALLVSRPEQSGVTAEEAQTAISTAAQTRDGGMITAIVLAADGRLNLTLPPESVYAAAKADSVYLVTQLLKSSASVDTPDSAGRTPLQIAAEAGSHKVASLLISLGAAPGQADKDGITALHLAAGSGSARLVAVLLKAGAQPNCVDADGMTPLHFLCLHANERDEEEYIAAASLLVETGAELNALNARGFAPVDYGIPFKNCGTGQPDALLTYLAGQGAHPSGL